MNAHEIVVITYSRNDAGDEARAKVKTQVDDEGNLELWVFNPLQISKGFNGRGPIQERCNDSHPLKHYGI